METEGRPPDLTPEQIISWLDECRQFMFEVWNSNPHLKEEWDRINQKQGI